MNSDRITTETPPPYEPSSPSYSYPPEPVEPLPLPHHPGSFRTFFLGSATRAGRMGWRLNLLLVVASFGTMWLAGGPIYALCTILILGSHEMGHYVFCRWYGVDATLPYFLPAPPPFMFGTFGAVIRMRPPIPSRRALFDIGIAGPIAGFLVAIPVLAWGVATSTVIPLAPLADGSFGDPLLLTGLVRWIHGPLPEAMGLEASPALFAGWFGLLVTAMNLFPVGQLDGGHVSYALSPRTHPLIARVVAIGMLVLVMVSVAYRFLNPWLLWTVVLLLLSRFRHPPVQVSDEPLGAVRLALAAAAAIIFVISFIPIPIVVRF